MNRIKNIQHPSLKISPQLKKVEKPRILTPLITVLIPVYNEQKNLPELIASLYDQLLKLSSRFEILTVDDGSTDQSAQVIIELAETYPLRLLKLSRNFGKENALTAGIDYAQGDIVIIMDADLQHPVEALALFFEKWQQGYDMVYGVRHDRKDEKFWKRHLTLLFYRIISLASEIPHDNRAGDFRLMDRQVVDALKRLPEQSRFMKGLYNWVGFKSIGVPFKVNERYQGKSQFTFFHLLKLAVTGITGFTTLPLRVWTVLGVIISLLSIIYGIVVLVKTLIFGVDLPGWATLTVGLTFLGGVQLLSIGILGEYIGKIFIEVKSRPMYIISQQYHYDNHQE